MATDDDLLADLASQPDAQPDPARASLVTGGAAPSLDSGRGFFAVLRVLRRVVALARQNQQDVAQLKSDVSAIKQRLGM
ncbi:MAG TPA: hypothetical protein VF041_23090 [Gemmatimonadaceae bacterium]